MRYWYIIIYLVIGWITGLCLYVFHSEFVIYELLDSSIKVIDKKTQAIRAFNLGIFLWWMVILTYALTLLYHITTSPSVLYISIDNGINKLKEIFKNKKITSLVIDDKYIDEIANNVYDALLKDNPNLLMSDVYLTVKKSVYKGIKDA